MGRGKINPSSKKRSKKSLALAAAAAAGLMGLSANARGWTNSGGGNWSNPNNWGGIVPNGVGIPAIFGNNPGITAPSTVDVDIPVTVGTINSTTSTPMRSRRPPAR
jgi:hypothetical protein